MAETEITMIMIMFILIQEHTYEVPVSINIVTNDTTVVEEFKIEILYVHGNVLHGLNSKSVMEGIKFA